MIIPSERSFHSIRLIGIFSANIPRLIKRCSTLGCIFLAFEAVQLYFSGLRGKGPIAVVTNLGILEPDSNGELILTALHPTKTFEEAHENTGWLLKKSKELRTTQPLTENELRILHEELDPTGIYLKEE